MTTTDVRRSWLVQRLTPPTHSGLRNPFAFGGGLRGGGLSPDAMHLLRHAFGFDYMGAAEFEWGAVPDTLRAFAADHKQLVAWTFTIDRSTVPPAFLDGKRAELGHATALALARAQHRDAVEQRAREWAAGTEDLKERTLLPHALRGDDYCRARGWLELDNGWFLFLNKTMWQETCRLFGVDPE